MTQLPEQLEKRVFTEFITDAEYAQLSRVDQDRYDNFWLAENTRRAQERYRTELVVEAAEARSRRDAREELLRQLVPGLRQEGLPDERIATLAQASMEEVRAVR